MDDETTVGGEVARRAIAAGRKLQASLEAAARQFQTVDDGVLQLVGQHALAADDPEMLTRISAFLQGMQELGWVVGRNLRLEYRFGAGDDGLIRKYATELAALSPDAR